MPGGVSRNLSGVGSGRIDGWMDRTPVILLVDDDAAILRTLKLQLRREPFEVVTAASPLLALRLLEERSVDIIASDERMPEMSGSELLRHVRERWPDVVRILLTGEADLETSARAIREGELYRFLSKPFGFGELARTLRQALNMKQMLETRARLSAVAT
jgi:DNA-binding NtrC family response regulator